jgi:hypothetical protein
MLKKTLKSLVQNCGYQSRGREVSAWQTVEVKESRKKPRVAQRVPGSLGSQISWHSAREGGEVVSLTHRPRLPPGMFLLLIFTRGWVDSRAMVLSEGNMSLKNPVTPPGIDPGTPGPITNSTSSNSIQQANFALRQACNSTRGEEI